MCIYMCIYIYIYGFSSIFAAQPQHKQTYVEEKQNMKHLGMQVVICSSITKIGSEHAQT